MLSSIQNKKRIIMKKILLTCLTLKLILCSSAQAEDEYSVTGELVLESRYFIEDPIYQEQLTNQNFISIQPKFNYYLENTIFTFEPIVKFGNKAINDDYFDIRKLLITHFVDDFEINIGIDKIFWGQMESLNLVNIINQTDFLSSIDGDDKLGQPMVSVSYKLDMGIITMYALPYFREREFPSLKERLRPPLDINQDYTMYESKDKEKNIDYAIRFQNSFGDLELGLSYFNGTSRIPRLEIAVIENTGINPLPKYRIETVPKYNLLEQYGVDLLYLLGSVSLKMEAISGKELEEEFYAYVVGLEYGYYGFLGSDYSIDLIAEYQFDERKNQEFIIGQNDIMIGARIDLNDFAGSEISLGYIKDLEYSGSSSGYIEASRRIGNNIRVSLKGYIFNAKDEEDMLRFFSKDDHAEINIEYFF